MQPIKLRRNSSVGLPPYIIFCSKWTSFNFCTLWERNKNKVIYCIDKFHFTSPWSAAGHFLSSLILWFCPSYTFSFDSEDICLVESYSYNAEFQAIYFVTLYFYIYITALPNSSLILCFSSGIAKYTEAIKLSPSMRKLSPCDSLQNQKGRINMWEYRKSATHSLSRSHNKIYFWGMLYVREFNILYIIYI